MPIEFRCTQCDKLLRTADDTAGKQAKCPACGTLLTIPAAAAGPPSPEPPELPAAAPPPSEPAGSPFGPPATQAAPGGVDSENPYASPGEYGAAPGVAPPPGSFQPTVIDFGEIFSRSWTIFKPNWGMCLLAVFIVVVLNMIVGYGVGFGAAMVGAAADNEVVALFASLIGNLAAQAFQIWIAIGQTLFFLKIARGQPAEIGDIFAGGPYFLRILGASILVGLMIFGGLLLLIVPGIILALMFWPFYFLILDRNMGVFDSISMAKELTAGNKLTVLAIWLVAGLLVLASMIPCCLGLLVSIPYFTLMYAVTYLTMSGQPTAEQLQTTPPVA